MDVETDELIPMEDSTIVTFLSDIGTFGKCLSCHSTKAEIAAKANLNVPNEYKDRYVDI